MFSVFAQGLISKLIVLKKTLATAESCTGGALANRITNVSGSSRVFLGGVVAYSNQLKTKILKVDPRLIKKYGAVSEKCVEAMARGIRRITGADICVAITGIAGPTGGTKQKPVGTAYIAILSHHKLMIKRLFVLAKRDIFKKKVCDEIICCVLKVLPKKKNSPQRGIL